MSAVAATKWSKVTFVVIALIIAAVGYILAPWFIPMYRYTQVDLGEIARQYNTTEQTLNQVYEVELYYNPRRFAVKAKDPAPWQVLTCTPPHPDFYDFVATRVLLINDHTGEPPSKLRLSSVDRESFFTARVRWLPPRSLGGKVQRPILLYEGFSFARLDTSASLNWQQQLKAGFADGFWEYDDDDYDDLLDAGIINEFGELVEVVE